MKCGVYNLLGGKMYANNNKEWGEWKYVVRFYVMHKTV